MYDRPFSFFVYEYSFPEGMPDPSLTGIVFYVGKGLDSSRIDHHLREAAGECVCRKCQTIRSIWDAGLLPVRQFVFQSSSEEEVLAEEARRMHLHDSPHLTNILRPRTRILNRRSIYERATPEEIEESRRNSIDISDDFAWGKFIPKPEVIAEGEKMWNP